MFGKSRDGNEPMHPVMRQPTANQPAARQPVVRQPAVSEAAESRPAYEQVSAISRDITVVGRIFGEGTVQVFGRIEGELRASTIAIHEGAQVEGDLVAEDLIIAGEVKGTILANRVKLNSSAHVEGDIFHRLLSMEENAHFEGTSKRQDKAVDLAGVRAPAAQNRDDDAVDLPRIPLRKPAAQDGVQVKVDLDVIEGEPKSNGHLAMADSPTLAPH